MTALRRFFRYFGSKAGTAHLYPVPEHDLIVEPFAGSAGYSLAHPDRLVWLVDIDERIVAIWRYLIGARESEILALPDVPPDGSVHGLGLHQEARWLIGYWLNVAGVVYPNSFPCKSMRAGPKTLLSGAKSQTAEFWGAPVRERIASQLHRIRHWKVFHGDYSIVPDVRATWFVDPPYEGMAHWYRHRWAIPDRADLAAWCRSRPGQAIVCEGGKAKWLPFRRIARKGQAVWTSSDESRLKEAA